jgi:2'-5' RNA ligase
MVRLFSALELPDPVRAELADRVRELRDQDGELRWVPADRWHITLGFYGDREHVDRRGAWFRRQATGLAPSRLRLRGAGRFPGVLWIGVNPMESRDAAALHTLAGALNADRNASEYDFTAHVTVARWRRGAAGSRSAIRAVRVLGDYHGSWWQAGEVVLFRSDTATGPDTGQGPVYTPLARVPLASSQG